MLEHRCKKCNKLLFKYSNTANIVSGKIEIETQHRCKSIGNEKEINTKTIE